MKPTQRSRKRHTVRERDPVDVWEMEAVDPPYIMQNMLLELCTEVSKLAHDAEDIVEPRR
jgi:hypothetical protein